MAIERDKDNRRDSDQILLSSKNRK